MNYKVIIMSGILLLLILLYVSKDEYTIEVVVNDNHVNVGKNELWVEVSLIEDDNKVIIRQGGTVIREMPCSGGTLESPTVTGIYYLQNRGEWFYSERFKEGAFYWIRFHEQYLFHSVPTDENRKIIKEEEIKIGRLASHGCVRLYLDDAKWFYENVPDDTMVAIHY